MSWVTSELAIPRWAAIYWDRHRFDGANVTDSLDKAATADSAAGEQNGGGGLRLVMMGTGPFAVPTMRAMYDSPHEVLALFTRPDRPQKGRTKTPPNPMRALATER